MGRCEELQDKRVRIGALAYSTEPSLAMAMDRGKALAASMRATLEYRYRDKQKIFAMYRESESFEDYVCRRLEYDLKIGKGDDK